MNLQNQQKVNNIEVVEPEILSNMSTETLDLSKLSAQQLKDELAKRAKASEGDKTAFKELSNENVPTLFEALKKWSDEGAALKTQIYSELKNLIDLKFKAYGVKTDQMSHTFTSENGESITIGYNVNAGYDDTVYLGVAKVKEFINSQISDEKTAKLVNQINRLLRPDKKGNLDPKRVLELKQMAADYNNLDFIEGVETIEKAYQPKRSTWYIKASFKNSVGIEQSLPLAISTIEFPKDFDLSYLLPNKEE